jgi:hypothetical protein
MVSLLDEVETWTELRGGPRALSRAGSLRRVAPPTPESHGRLAVPESTVSAATSASDREQASEALQLVGQSKAVVPPAH